MTREQLDAAVRDYLQRPNLTQAALDAFVSVVEGTLNRALLDHPRSLKRGVWTALDSSGLIPIPTDMAKIERVMDADGVLFEQYPPTSPPTERGFIQRGTVFELLPAPETGDVVYCDYIAYLAALTAPSDENWVSKYHFDVYLYGCLREAAVYFREEERLALWSGEFNARAGALTLQGWEQNVAQAPVARRG